MSSHRLIGSLGRMAWILCLCGVLAGFAWLATLTPVAAYADFWHNLTCIMLYFIMAESVHRMEKENS